MFSPSVLQWLFLENSLKFGFKFMFVFSACVFSINVYHTTCLVNVLVKAVLGARRSACVCILHQFH